MLTISFGDKNRKSKVKVEQKKRLEFMQKILIVLIFISVLFTSCSYLLSFVDKNPVEQLSIEIIRTLWLVDGMGIGAYAFQNSMRAKWFGDKTPNQTENINETSDNI